MMQCDEDKISVRAPYCWQVSMLHNMYDVVTSFFCYVHVSLLYWFDGCWSRGVMPLGIMRTLMFLSVFVSTAMFAVILASVPNPEWYREGVSSVALASHGGWCVSTLVRWRRCRCRCSSCWQGIMASAHLEDILLRDKYWDYQVDDDQR